MKIAMVKRDLLTKGCNARSLKHCN